MLAYKAAHSCLSSFSTDPSPDQIKRNIDVMKKAADNVVINARRQNQDKGEGKMKRKSAWT